MRDLSSTAHLSRSERSAEQILFRLPSGTSGTRPDENGGKFPVCFMSQQLRQHGSGRAKGSATPAGGSSSASVSPATSRLRTAATAARLYSSIFLVLEWTS